MAPLYGRLAPDDKKQVTRTAHREITATVESWTGRVSVTMFGDGTFFVETGEKYGPGEVVFEGSVDEGGEGR